jgi:hypothetical protein
MELKSRSFTSKEPQVADPWSRGMHVKQLLLLAKSKFISPTVLHLK